MGSASSSLDLNYASDLQFIQAMYEDDSFWECILDVKLDYLNDGIDPHGAPCVRPEIADSWVMSKKLGLNPDLLYVGERVSDEHYELSATKSAQLINAAKPLLESVESLNMKNDYVFELLGTDGVSYLQIGDLQLHEFISDRCLLDESNVGTNAHSLCMRYKKPFIVIGPEHYCFALHGLIACAAPIIDQYDNPIGALLLTQPIPDGPLSSSGRKLLVHAMSLLSTLAKTISAQLRLRSYDDRLSDAQLRYSEAHHSAQHFEDISETLINTLKEGVLVLDGAFTVMYASPEAAHVFSSSPKEIAGASLFDLFSSEDKATTINSLLREESLEIAINDRTYAVRAKRLSTDTADIETDGFILSFAKIKTRPTLGASKKAQSGDTATVTFEDILGRSCQIERARGLASRFARTDENILITGESGTGKELFAQAIHNQARHDGPFISINCAAIPPRLIESELFGYESGSFTGAEKGGKPGKVELADGGTLFLDEIGDMPLELQATLLRVLENKRIVRVGGTSYKQVDFHLVAATNQNLGELVARSLFREDLLYRLSVLTINLPPLRNRIGDCVFFARYFLNECQIKTGNGPAELSPEALEFVEAYRWPGNVRQLKHAIYSAYYTSENGVIAIDDFPAYIVKDLDITPASISINESSSTVKVPGTSQAASPQGCPKTNQRGYSLLVHHDEPKGSIPFGSFSSSASSALPTLSLETLEELAIRQALDRCQNNIAEAAKLLGISKATLYRKTKAIKR